ncbi:MAG: DEAD/DEAH box helicase family protein [Salegentibacter mishustinae]|nr:DEAD/DEAH box helicase family protein [Salegentibacter mishustinae]
MKNNFQNLELPKTLKVSSSGNNMRPLQFFGRIIPTSSKIQFKLGYFSSNSIRTLSYGFAQFIYNGGTIDFLINHFVTDEDYKLLNDKVEEDPEIYEKIQKEIMIDLNQLHNALSKKEVEHFYNCLRYLKDSGKINFLPVTTNDGKISHYKEALFWDNENNVININGSCNFTHSGLVDNGESISIHRSWGSEAEQENIKKEITEYKKIFSKDSEDFIYLNPENLINIINDNSVPKDKRELLEDESNLIEIRKKKGDELAEVMKEFEEDFLEFKLKMQEKPRFPFPEGPRPYQKEAVQNWLDNDMVGLFAMATGTGKTITSLSAALEIYKKNGFYKLLILVPTKALVEQWNEELKLFNFSNILKVGSKHFYEDLKYIFNDQNFCILSTYATFKSKKFQQELNEENLKELTLIADECHTMGSPGQRKLLPKTRKIPFRIGLSATPSRYFDEEGEKDVLNIFDIAVINEQPEYTYSFDIKQAINAKPEPFLTGYDYRIKFVNLEPKELAKYKKYTKQLSAHRDPNGNLKDSKEVERILKLRKDIIKKAQNKKKTLVNIIDEIGEENFKYAFVYVPEGKEIDYSESDIGWDNYTEEEMKIIEDYSKTINKKFNNRISFRHFTGNTNDRQEVLKSFSLQNLDALFAMKCLDEGVDVPRTEIAIFCSSSGNPRQYVQRRGRVLRLHKNKSHALIYDMIVIPAWPDLKSESENFNSERNLVKGELRRLIEFAKDSMYPNNIYLNEKLIEICDFFEINLTKLINEK